MAMCSNTRHDLSIVGVIPPSPSRLARAPNAQGTCRGCARDSAREASRARRARDRGDYYDPATYQPVMGRPHSRTVTLPLVNRVRIAPGQHADEWIHSGFSGTTRRFISALESWMEQGLCRDPGVDIELFYPQDGTPSAEQQARFAKAKEVCHDCAFMRQCRDYALDNGERVGVWGGMTAMERQRELTRRARKEQEDSHVHL